MTHEQCRRFWGRACRWWPVFAEWRRDAYARGAYEEAAQIEDVKCAVRWPAAFARKT